MNKNSVHCSAASRKPLLSQNNISACLQLSVHVRLSVILERLSSKLDTIKMFSAARLKEHDGLELL